MDESIRILIVDDEPQMCETLSDILSEEGYSVSTATNGTDALELNGQHFHNVALIDIKLPDINGIQVLQKIKETHPETIAIMMTAYASLKNTIDALNKGADAYFSKPIDLDEVKAIIRKEVHHQSVQREKTRLEQELEEDFAAVLETLAALIEVKDLYLAGHSQEVKELSRTVAQKFGLSGDQIRDVEMGAILHDIGKIGVDGRILDKPGSLTSTQYQEVKLHPILGESAIRHIRRLKAASKIIRHHHEFWDGRGYPDGIKEEKIPIGSRIISVVDAYNAMTSDRPYRKALPNEEAVSRLIKDKGRQFDPKVVDAFIDCLKDRRKQKEATLQKK